jgi:hypothetical protein
MTHTNWQHELSAWRRVVAVNMLKDVNHMHTAVTPMPHSCTEPPNPPEMPSSRSYVATALTIVLVLAN